MRPPSDKPLSIMQTARKDLLRGVPQQQKENAALRIAHTEHLPMAVAFGRRTTSVRMN